MHLSELKTNHVTQLVEMAASSGIENASRLRKQDLIFALLKSHAKKGESIFGDGKSLVFLAAFHMRKNEIFVSAQFVGRLCNDVGEQS